MRIVHLTSVHSLNDTRITLKMCASLAKAGHEVHLVGIDTGVPANAIPQGIITHTVPPPKNRYDRMRRVAQQVFKLSASLDGDIYHFHDPEGLGFALHWQKKLKRPFVYDVHEDYREKILTKTWIPQGWPRKYVSRAFALRENYVTSRLGGVIAATPTIARHFKTVSNLAIVHNYPMLHEFIDIPIDAQKLPGYLHMLAVLNTQEAQLK